LARIGEVGKSGGQPGFGLDGGGERRAVLFDLALESRDLP
jgi:hypothetical protein